jgi:hypothetical protein
MSRTATTLADTAHDAAVRALSVADNPVRCARVWRYALVGAEPDLWAACAATVAAAVVAAHQAAGVALLPAGAPEGRLVDDPTSMPTGVRDLGYVEAALTAATVRASDLGTTAPPPAPTGPSAPTSAWRGMRLPLHPDERGLLARADVTVAPVAGRLLPAAMLLSAELATLNPAVAHAPAEVAHNAFARACDRARGRPVRSLTAALAGTALTAVLALPASGRHLDALLGEAHAVSRTQAEQPAAPALADVLDLVRHDTPGGHLRLADAHATLHAAAVVLGAGARVLPGGLHTVSAAITEAARAVDRQPVQQQAA